MESFYENLLARFSPNEEEEKRELAIILNNLLEVFDGTSAFNLGKTYVNLSHMYGITMKKIRTEVLKIEETDELDEKVRMIADVVYKSKWDRLEGATFALSTKDVLRLKLNRIKGLQPDYTLEGTENGKQCFIYFYKGLPLITLEEGKND